MTRPGIVNVQFRLGAAGSASAVEVTIRSFGERWMALALIGGVEQVGLGRTARLALAGALASLGQHAVRAYLADLALLAPSVEIARQEQAVGA